MNDLTIKFINRLNEIKDAIIEIRKDLRKNNITYDGTLSSVIHDVNWSSGRLVDYINNQYKETETYKK